MFSACFTESAGAHRDHLHRLRIVENLRFTDIADRYEHIEEAHRRTFEWIFSENGCPQPSENQPTSGNYGHVPIPFHSNFVEWLHGSESLYWLTGKPGSGKSTLMKYVYNDQRTLSHLEKWRGDDTLITAGFFLWNSGTVMQMSNMGLLRALLYQALKDSPHDVSRVLPERCRYLELFGADTRSWSLSELKKAFEILVSATSTKFFFVIDGLDEFDGDCKELAAWICGASTRPNVKLCVASRPWLVFEEAFSAIPFLRVEDLTSSDIKKFTIDKLQAHEIFRKLQELDPGNAQKLVTEVQEKASGVFLWVRLVVMSLLEGLRDGDTMTHLREKLRELPPDLENLFRKILDQLEPPHLREASRILRVALATSDEPISLLAISFVDQNIQEAFSSDIQTEGDPVDITFRAELARRRLSSRCKGLLEAPTFHADGADTKVKFLHRTVRDFIQRDNIEVTIHGVEKDFDPYEAICTCQILNLKTRGLDPSPEFTAAFYQAAVLSESIQSTDDAFKAAVVIELERIGIAMYGYIPQSNHQGPSSQALPWLDLVHDGGPLYYDRQIFFD